MATITENYVSFETAKLLKEKGFEGQCHIFDNTTTKTFGEKWNVESTIDTPIPTLQMAMKWLREVHNIFVCIVLLEDIDGYGFTIENTINKKYIATSKNDGYSTYEEVCEVAIKYCLENLI